MLIYNVTTKVDEVIAAEWLSWLLKEHLSEVMATGCFTEYRLVRLLEIDDSEGPTYAIQYHAESKAFYNRYLQIHASLLRQKSIDKWANKVLAFRSLMELISDGNSIK